jgi:four helix bundle protein
MNKDELKKRTKAFALRVMTLVDHLPKNAKGRVLGDQLLRSGTSVAANYRAACRARSTAKFISKLGNVLEESDESALWMELITEGGLLPAKRVSSLLTESNELTAIFFTARRSTQRLKNKSQILIPKC